MPLDLLIYVEMFRNGTGIGRKKIFHQRFLKVELIPKTKKVQCLVEVVTDPIRDGFDELSIVRTSDMAKYIPDKNQQPNPKNFVSALFRTRYCLPCELCFHVIRFFAGSNA